MRRTLTLRRPHLWFFTDLLKSLFEALDSQCHLSQFALQFQRDLMHHFKIALHMRQRHFERQDSIG